MFATTHTPGRAVGAAVLVLFMAAGPLFAWPGDEPDGDKTVFVTGVWSDNTVHVNDKGLNNLGVLPLVDPGSPKPNALATDGSYVWSVRNSLQEMLIYNDTGVQVAWWEDPVLGIAQGMTYVPFDQAPDIPLVGALAIAAVDATTEIRLYDASNGTFLRSIIVLPGPNIEGLAWDGQYLRALSLTEITAIDIGSDTVPGSVVPGMAIPSPAWSGAAAPPAGMGLTANFDGQLTVVTSSGDWWVVHDNDGSVITSGNNGMEMYALTAVVPTDITPEPMTVAVLLFGMVPIVLVRRRRRARR